MSGVSEDELACIYSAAILADDDVPVTEDKIKTLLKAANVTVENIWPALYSKALQGRNVRELIGAAVMSAGPAQGSGSAQAAGPGDAAATQAAPAAAAKPESDDESDDDMGFGLFD